MAKNIVKVEETKNTKKKKNIDFSKIGKVISENQDTIEKVVDLIGDSINTNNTKTTKTAKKGKSTKKSSKSIKTKSDSSSLSSIISIFGNLFKK